MLNFWLTRSLYSSTILANIFIFVHWGGKMDTNYYEELIKNISNVEIEESDREAFFDSYAAIKCEKEFFKNFNIIIRMFKHPNILKEMLKKWDIPIENIDKIIYFFEHLDYISSNDEVLNWIMNIDSSILYELLRYSKPSMLGDIERFNKKYFPIYNYPIIRIMDYCLKNGYFEHFSVCTKRLENWAIDAYWNARHNLIEETISAYRNNPDFFFIFSNREVSIIKKYITLNDIPNLTYKTAKMLISQNILPKDFINTDEFFNVFKTFTLDEQIEITELLVRYDFSSEFITKLHLLFNKNHIEKIEDNGIKIITKNILEVSTDYLKKIAEEIKYSSYFEKFNIEKNEFWLFINELLGGGLKHIDRLDEYSYAKLMELYQKCYNYATESIVSSLYPLSELKDDITYINQDKYNLLCRVQTFFDLDDLDKSFRERTFCGFSILNQDNFSHYPGNLVYGYYSKVTPDMIAHIFPADSLSSSWALYKKDLSKKINMLLDIDDLNAITYKNKTYNQLCIRTKTNDNEILKEDAIICFDTVNDRALRHQEKHNSKILVLRRNKHTIEYNEDIYSDLN